MDLISIFIPVYNTGEPLRACLDSVVNQTYPNLEIIVVDDHSTDPLTLEILQEFAQKDSRIKLTLNSENHGVYHCRNEGLSKITGSYFALLDSDDRMVPDFIERMYKAIIENQTDFVVCDFSNFTLDKNVPFEVYGNWNIEEAPCINIKEFVHSDKFMGMPISVFCKLINTEKYRQANISFDEEFRFAGDNVWCFELFLKLKNFTVLRFNGVERLLREGSLTHIFTEKRFTNNYRLLLKKKDLLKQNGLLDLHRVVFLEECFCCISAIGDFPINKENYPKFQQLTQQLFDGVGVDVTGRPSKFDVLSAKLLYKLYKALNNHDLKIINKGKYMYYSKLYQLRDRLF